MDFVPKKMFSQKNFCQKPVSPKNKIGQEIEI
jgi:hypothetical protein